MSEHNPDQFFIVLRSVFFVSFSILPIVVVIIIFFFMYGLFILFL